MKTLGYWLYAIQMQIYWTIVVTGGLYLADLSFLMIISILATIGDFYGRIVVEYRQVRREVIASQHKSITEQLRVRQKWLRAQKFAPCRRFATGAAIRDIGYARRFYRNLGYRWWHVFPDGFYKRMWSAAYWKQALFKH